MNKWIGIGRLTADPDIRQTQSGKTVASYRMAVDRPFKQEGQPDADFISCVAFGKSADFVSNYLYKGIKIAVEGRIQTRTYDDKDGKKVYVTEVIVDRHEFCEGKQTAGKAAEAIVEDAAPIASSDFEEIHEEDDLPF
jgi:single-strand DNA-binding protein